MPDLKSLAESRSAVFNFDPRKLKLREGWNARDTANPENAAHVEALSLSIAANGVRVPLTIVQDGDDVVVTDGHCRLDATLLAISRGAEILTIPCIAEKRGSNEADHVLSMITCNSGKPLSPLEQGGVYKRLIDFGWSSAKIAEKAGRSVTHVNQALQMQASPVEVQALIASGQVSATLAAEALRTQGTAAEATAALSDAVKTAKAAGKAKATKRHLKAAEAAASTLNVFDEARTTWGNEMLGVTVTALRKIRDSDGSTDVLRHIATETLIEIQDEGVTGATGTP